MGIFNEQSFDHPFAKGIQGAPGVGFSLTADGNYDMNEKRLTNVGAPSANTDAATKKYVDDNSSGSPTTTRLTVDSDINMKNTYRIQKLRLPTNLDEPATKLYTDSNFFKKDGTQPMTGDIDMNNNNIKNLLIPSLNNDAANKVYVDNTVASNKVDGSVFLKLDGTRKMTGNLDMDNNRIYNLPAPTNGKQPTPLAFTDFKYLHVAGTNKMTNNLNMDSKKIFHLKSPTASTDAANKKYVDDNTGAPDLSDYLEKDRTVAMTGNFNVGGHKITNLKTPTSDTDATNKEYTDNLIHHSNVQPSHYKDEFSYLMSDSNQWADEIDGGNSFNITSIGDLEPNKGNFHVYNHKVLKMEMYKNSQGGYKYKMGINFYRLTANSDYSLCLELLNTDYQLWHKSQISVDRGTSQGLTTGNESIKKYTHRYLDSNGQPQFMYYHRIIVNFRKTTSVPYFLHILVNIPQTGTDLAVYPRKFLGVYMIAYGIMGTASNIDPDKVYDYHTAFDIKPTEVEYNVDINTNNKKILNIALDKNSNNSAATVGMVKDLIPFTTNILYRKYFEEVFDFTDANNYGLSRGSSGIIINSLDSITGNPFNNIGIPNRTIDDVRKDGLDVNGYNISYHSPIGISKYTLCIVFVHWRNRNFSITKKDSNNNSVLLHLYYLKINNTVNLVVNNINRKFTMLSSFNGKKNCFMAGRRF